MVLGLNVWGSSGKFTCARKSGAVWALAKVGGGGCVCGCACVRWVGDVSVRLYYKRAIERGGPRMGSS